MVAMSVGDNEAGAARDRSFRTPPFFQVLLGSPHLPHFLDRRLERPVDGELLGVNGLLL
jgi:hypothetical protein